MNIRRHLELPNWHKATVQVAVDYWRSRGFSNLCIDAGPAVTGQRSSTLRSFFPQYYFWREKEGFFDIDWRRYRARLRMSPGDLDGVRLDLNVFVPGDFSFRWTEWGAAFWRLEIVELHHLLRGEAGIEDVWRRFEEAERSATRAFVWTKGFAGGRISDKWEAEISDLEVKLLLAG